LLVNVVDRMNQDAATQKVDHAAHSCVPVPSREDREHAYHTSHGPENDGSHVMMGGMLLETCGEDQNLVGQDRQEDGKGTESWEENDEKDGRERWDEKAGVEHD